MWTTLPFCTPLGELQILAAFESSEESDTRSVFDTGRCNLTSADGWVPCPFPVVQAHSDRAPNQLIAFVAGDLSHRCIGGARAEYDVTIPHCIQASAIHNCTRIQWQTVTVETHGQVHFSSPMCGCLSSVAQLTSTVRWLLSAPSPICSALPCAIPNQPVPGAA